MIFGDCDNNFVFINALQYTLYMHIIFFLFLGYKPKNQKTKKKHKKTKKTKNQLLILKKPWFFAPLVQTITFNTRRSYGCFLTPRAEFSNAIL